MAAQKKILPEASRGKHVLLTRKKNPSIWIVRTKEDNEKIQEEIAKTGRFIDDAGEPIMISCYGGWNDAGDHVSLSVEVKSRRAKWKHWGRKPTRLRTGYCAKLDREILFQAP